MKKIFTTLLIINSLALTSIVAQNDTALYFDGSNDYIEASGTTMNSLGSGDFTFEAYIKGIEAQQGQHPIIFSSRPNSGDGGKLFFHDVWGSSNYKMLSVQLDGTNYFLINNGTFNASILDGSCHHVSVSRKNDTLYYYVDGSNIGQVYIWNSNSSISTNVPLWIGRDGPINNTFDGTISQVRIWNVARTQAEISNNMNVSISGSTPGLLAYYELDEGTGQVAIDKTGNNHGQYGNSASNDIYDPVRTSNYCLSNVGIIGQNQNLASKIYPNPSNGVFNIELAKNIDNTKVEVYDLIGNKIIEEQTISNFISINISNQPNGVYFIKLSDDKTITTEKITKQ